LYWPGGPVDGGAWSTAGADCAEILDLTDRTDDTRFSSARDGDVKFSETRDGTLDNLGFGRVGSAGVEYRWLALGLLQLVWPDCGVDGPCGDSVE
jgi:hypothetical protein